MAGKWDALINDAVRQYMEALDRLIAERLAELPCGLRITRPELKVTAEGNDIFYRYESSVIPDPEVPAGQVVWE